MRNAGLTALLGAALIATPLAGEPRISHYERHVAFDNARVAGPWFYGRGDVAAPSRLELEQGRITADTARFHSAPNSLRIGWTSQTGGGWSVAIEATRQRGLFDFAGDTLSLWVFSEDELNPGNSPRISLSDSAGNGTASIDLAGKGRTIPAGQWVRVQLPIKSFVGLSRSTGGERFNLAALRNIVLVQGLDDGKPHRLWIDDIRIEDSTLSDRQAPAAPGALDSRGFDRHVELAWQAGPDSDVESWRIYRSLGKGPFEPIAIQRGEWTRFQDFLGASGVAARYRVTAVDVAGNESAPSTIAAAKTRELSDEDLLDMVQLGNFRYYWDGAQPDSGMAVEVTPGDPDQIALGSSGWGVNALVAGIERNFITRRQGLERMLRIVRFLDRVPRFHGAWPHFIDGRTAQPMAVFGPYDDGGDLVETAFMIQGLLVARQYFGRDTPEERELRATINRFWHEVEWDWYRQQPDSPFLYWHWSARHGFYVNHPLIGWNETGIVYLLAIASPTHPVPASLWHSGFAGQNETAVGYRQGWSRTTQGDHYTNGNSYYGIPLQVGEGSGAELFFPQFNFMGLDPRQLKDGKADYFANSAAIARIARAYAVDNPRKCKGYGADAWGRSAGIFAAGGRSLPVDDNCTLVIHASLGMMPFTPAESMAALKHYYRDLGDRTWGTFGFVDSFNQQENWHDETYMALNQAPTVVMIENHRSGMIWRLFMSSPEIAPALRAIAD